MEEEIKKLHGMTGLGISECRRAYEKFGNIEEAYIYLRNKWRGVWTTNEITYRDSIPVDSVVVFKK